MNSSTIYIKMYIALINNPTNLKAAKQSKNPSWWHVSQAKKKKSTPMPWYWLIHRHSDHGQSLIEGRIPSGNQPTRICFMAHVTDVFVIISVSYSSNLTTTVHPKFLNVCSFQVTDPIVQHHRICSAGGAVRGKDLRCLKTAKFKDMDQAIWTQIQIITSKSQCYQLDMTKHQSCV